MRTRASSSTDGRSNAPMRRSAGTWPLPPNHRCRGIHSAIAATALSMPEPYDGRTGLSRSDAARRRTGAARGSRAVRGRPRLSPGRTSSPTVMTSVDDASRSGTSQMPNQVLPSHLRCFASVRIGSLPRASVVGSIVVITQRSQVPLTRNRTSPSCTNGQPSSANGASGSPSMITFGRKRSMFSGGVDSSVQRSSWARDDSFASSSGAASASVIRSPGRPPRSGFTARTRGSGCQISRTGRPRRMPSQSFASDSAGRAVPCRDWPTATGSASSGTSTRSGSPPPSRSASSSPPSASTSAVSASRALASRAVTSSPSGSTTAHRRSPASPHGSTVAEPTSAPANDFTGYTRRRVTFMRVRYPHGQGPDRRMPRRGQPRDAASGHRPPSSVEQVAPMRAPSTRLGWPHR